MAAELSLRRRLLMIVVPTRVQALLCLFLALVLLIALQFDQFIRALGVNDIAINATQSELHGQFAGLLTSQYASSAALVTFWAIVGLIAYLICWSAYNVLIEARNEVTLETQYTNRGHWQGPIRTLKFKLVGAVVLIAAFALLGPGLASWLGLFSPIIMAFNSANLGPAVLSVLGMGLQLYLVLLGLILTFTPWYREEAFTDR